MMPLPKPERSETREVYIKRATEFLAAENCGKPKSKQRSSTQIAAIAESAWETYAKSDPSSVVAQLTKVRDFLVAKFGDRGRCQFERTLELLGFKDGKIDGRFAFDVDASVLPFIKSDANGTTVGNLVFAEASFSKIDADAATVEGYANTIVADVVRDVVFPISYKDSVARYGSDIFFMHRREVHGGKIVEQHIDEIGWYVKSAPDSDVWPLIVNGKIKGYSIGGYFVFGSKVGAAQVYDEPFMVEIDDLSYVSSPCNKLSFFEGSQPAINKESKTKQDASTAPATTKSKSQLTDSEVVKTQNKTLKEKTILSEQEQKPKPKPEDEEEESAEESKKQQKSIYDMTPDEIIAHLAKQAEEKYRQTLIKKAEVVEAQRKQSDEDTFKKQALETFGKINARLDEMAGQLSTLFAKSAITEEKFNKLDTEVADVQVTAHTQPSPVKAANFTEFAEGAL